PTHLTNKISRNILLPIIHRMKGHQSTIRSSQPSIVSNPRYSNLSCVPWARRHDTQSLLYLQFHLIYVSLRVNLHKYLHLQIESKHQWMTFSINVRIEELVLHFR